MTLLGTTVGHIRIIDLLGSGGMGEVYVGHDERLHRKVALKAIHDRFRRDAEAKARFQREAQVLSRLDHPNICRIYDYMEAEEHDFLVLELVAGRTLRARLKEEPRPADAMAIAQQIAAALVAAHEKGVVHRDLKPENVMLTAAGQVKVLDFGLARLAIDEGATTIDLRRDGDGAGPTGPDDSLFASANGVHTVRGSVVGTLGYMSPEQARGEAVTAASDIFSFGLILHELFSGRPAYAPDPDSAARLERMRRAETEPVSGVDRDLALLINRLKAAEPAARPTARDASDHLHWIAGKGRRRLRRAAVALGVAAAVFGLLKYTVDLRRERSAALVARSHAEQSQREAEQVIEFLVRLFKVADPTANRGETVTAREILDRGAERVAGDLKGEPRVLARLETTIARVYEELGLYPSAVRLAEHSLQLRRAQHGEESAEFAEGTRHLGDLYRKQARYAEAEPLITRTVALDEALWGPESPLVVRDLNVLAVLYENWGRYAAADPLYERALAILDRDPGADQLAIAEVLTNLAILRAKQGKLTEAEPLFKRVVAIEEEKLGPDHPRLGVSLTNLGIVYKMMRRYGEAEPLYRRALAINERVVGPEHRATANTVQSLANVYLEEGDFGRAEPLYQRALVIYAKALGTAHPDYGRALNNLALCRDRLGNLASAEELYRQALAIRERSLGPDHPEVATSLRDIADIERRFGRLSEAEPLARRALAIQERALGSTHPHLASTLLCLGDICRDGRREAEAETYYRRVLAMGAQGVDLDPEVVAAATRGLATANGAPKAPGAGHD